MNETETLTLGDPLPRIKSVSSQAGFEIVVTWEIGAREGRVETIDLAPVIFRFKVYAPLRDDADLFRSVRVIDGGFAIAWGDEDAIDMASTTIENLASQAMTPSDFAAFVKRHNYTLDAVAAELGISRRQAAYYQSEKTVPRLVGLACAYIDQKSGMTVGTSRKKKEAGSNPKR